MNYRVYFELDEDELYELNRFTRDLTMSAELGLLDPLIGRERELDRMIRVLCRRTKNNPVIIGEPGVGKTALVEGLAQKIANHTHTTYEKCTGQYLGEKTAIFVTHY